MLHFLATHYRNKVSQLQAWCDLDDNFVDLYKLILFYQGFWPALEPTHGQRFSRFSRFRYWNPRLVVSSWVYNAVITFPMTVYMVSGESPVAQLEPVIFIIVSVIMAAMGICLLYRSSTFDAVVEGLKTVKGCSSRLQEHPAHILARGKTRREVLLGIVLTLWVLAVLGVFSPLPYLVSKRKLYIRCWHAYNITEFPLYEITLLGWVAHFCTDVGYSFPTMVLLCTFLAEAIQHFELLNHNLATVRQAGMLLAWNSRVQVADLAQHRANVAMNMARSLKSCVRYHQAIISYVAAIEKCYNLLIVMFLFGILVPACLAIVALPYVHITTAMVVQVMLIICVCTAMSISFTFATSITEQSELVRESVFNSDWLTASESFKRSMRIIMARSNKPVMLKVAGFMDMSLVNLREVFYLTYKFYMFVSDFNLVTENKASN